MSIKAKAHVAKSYEDGKHVVTEVRFYGLEDGVHVKTLHLSPEQAEAEYSHDGEYDVEPDVSEEIVLSEPDEIVPASA
jgi:hypothetical protein